MVVSIDKELDFNVVTGGGYDCGGVAGGGVAGGGGYIAKISPGGDFSISRSDVVSDSGGDPLDGIYTKPCGFQDRTEMVVYESRGSLEGMGFSDLVARADRIENLIQDACDHEPDKFSPTLSLLFEKSNHSVSVLQANLWRDYWTVIRRIELLRSISARSPRGTRGITSHGRRMVKSACTLLQRKYGKDCLVFFTATIPQLPDADLRCICENFSEIVRQFRQMVQRFANEHGLEDFEIVHVVELQERRFQQTGYAVPHLHAVFPGRRDRRSMWTFWIGKLDEFWERAVSNVVGHEIKMPAACNTKRVKKDAARYLGKYCSKGSASVKRVMKWGQKLPLPSSWYGVTKGLRMDIVRATVRRRVAGSFTVFARALDACPFRVWWKEYIISESGRTTAIYGAIPPDRITDFCLWLENASEQFLHSQNIALELGG